MSIRKICLCGNSVIMGTLNSRLRQQVDYEVISLKTSPASTEISAVRPDVIFFDLDSPSPRAAFDLLETRPEVTLVGVSPDANVVRVWSGKQLKEISTKDLIRVINESSTV
ncbi:hypothetical protein DEALK_11640 [Dehalogenimonas alkenigignens]|uniref:Response regulatory domain-containing protein n=1 Tax=Dehalogenimonas alkenigignens TaxID=1217799 RepID=A0A0W0GIF7_9CHLR|nr:hypothetical protein DEALK_11640 [Dehalogenimonas alkenigignens]